VIHTARHTHKTSIAEADWGLIVTRRTVELTDKEHFTDLRTGFARIAGACRLKTIKVDTIGDIVDVPGYRFISRFLYTIGKHNNNLSKDIVDLQRNRTLLREIVPERCSWIKGVGIVLM
jgi:hypothetical protein